MSTGNGSKTLRQYDLRTDKGRWLARVVICDDGYFSTVSDYGNYGFWWGAAGDCFRSFLCRLEPDYLCGKLAPETVYYGQETEKNIRRRILEWRRDGSLSRDDARREWDLIGEVDIDRLEGFTLWYQDTRLPDASELAEYGHSKQALAFCEVAWPVLCAALRAELAAEAKQATTEAS